MALENRRNSSGKKRQKGNVRKNSSCRPAVPNAENKIEFDCTSLRQGIQQALKKLRLGRHKEDEEAKRILAKKSYEQLDTEVEDLESPVYRRPRGLDQLAKVTHFSRVELKKLYRDFKAAYPSGVIREENFKAGYAQLFPKGANTSHYSRYVFNTFDRDQTGIIGFEDLVLGLSELCRGSLEQKLKWTFRLYDIDGDSVISKSEMEEVISSVAYLTGAHEDDEVERRTRLWVEWIFEKMDTNKDDVISLDEFLSCCLQDETIRRSLTVFDDLIEDVML